MKFNYFHLIFLIFFIAFLDPAYAVELKNAPLVERLNVDFEQYGSVQISGGDLQYIALNISTFQNNENQKIDFLDTLEFGTDEFQNEKLALLQKSKSLEFNYDVKGFAEISGMHTYTLPMNYRISESEKKYLLPTKNIQSDDAEIIRLARNITKGAANDFQKAALLAIWVNANVNYTLDLAGEAKDAKWVLAHKIGTCDEFSTLYIAMARSVGIPAKYISGWVYGNSGWQRHAWAEVFIGKWVPIDATWLEVGHIDATHIKFMETADNYVANQAKSLGSSVGTINWKSDEVMLSIKNFRETEPKIFEEFASANTLGIGKSAIVGIKIVPQEYSAEKFSLMPCKGIDVIRIENPEQKIILEPGKERIVFWKISSNPDIDAGSIYTCPLSVNSRFFEKAAINITVDPRLKDSAELEAELNKYVAQADETLTLLAAPKYIQKGAIKLGFASENEVSEKELALGAGSNVAEFEFSSGAAGPHSVYAYSDKGDVVRQDYNVYETGEVFIEKITAPEFVKLGGNAVIETYIKNNRHSAENTRFAVKLGDELIIDESSSIPPASLRLVNLTIPSQKTGILRYSMRLTSDSIEEKIKEIRVYEVPELEYEGDYDSNTKEAILKIIPHKDDAKNVSITISGQTKEIPVANMDETASVSFSIPEGAYDVIITGSDVAGNKYSDTKSIEFRRKGMLDFFYAIYLWFAGLVR